MREDKKTPLTVQQTIDLVKDCYTVATERDIYTGDSVDIFVITSKGIEKLEFPLKQD